MTIRRLSFAVCALALLLPSAPAFAGFVIDNFSTNVPELEVGGVNGSTHSTSLTGLGDTSGTRDITVTGSSTASITGGLVSLTFGGGPASVVFKYTFDTLGGIDLHSAGLSRFLQVPFFVDFTTGSANRDIRLDVNYKSLTTSTNRNFAERHMTAVNNGMQVYDGTLLGDGALASSVSELTITMTKVAGSGTADNNNGGGNQILQAVPEPGSMLLAGISSLGALGMAFLRKRSKKQSA